MAEAQGQRAWQARHTLSLATWHTGDSSDDRGGKPRGSKAIKLLTLQPSSTPATSSFSPFHVPGRCY